MNRWLQLVLMIITLNFVIGCSSNNVSAYKGGANSSVAVLHAYDPRQRNIESGSFQGIDGKRFTCGHQCPQAVQVEPGKHTFILKVRSVGSSVDGSTYSFEVEVPVTVKNMEAGKVYTVQYITSQYNKNISARIDYAANIPSTYVNTSSSHQDQDQNHKPSHGHHPRRKKGFISRHAKINISRSVGHSIKSPTSIVKSSVHSAKRNLKNKMHPNPQKLMNKTHKILKKPF